VGRFANKAARLSQWRMRAFDSAQACEGYKSQFWYGLTDPAKSTFFSKLLNASLATIRASGKNRR
jgi:hypothetical protein